MPLTEAQEIIKNPHATKDQLHECISKINRQIGHLRCRVGKEPQLMPDLIQLEQILATLESKYNAKPKN